MKSGSGRRSEQQRGQQQERQAQAQAQQRRRRQPRQNRKAPPPPPPASSGPIGPSAQHQSQPLPSFHQETPQPQAHNLGSAQQSQTASSTTASRSKASVPGKSTQKSQGHQQQDQASDPSANRSLANISHTTFARASIPTRPATLDRSRDITTPTTSNASSNSNNDNNESANMPPSLYDHLLTATTDNPRVQKSARYSERHSFANAMDSIVPNDPQFGMFNNDQLNSLINSGVMLNPTANQQANASLFDKQTPATVPDSASMGWWKFGEFPSRNDLVDKIMHEQSDDFYAHLSAVASPAPIMPLSSSFVETSANATSAQEQAMQTMDLKPQAVDNFLAPPMTPAAHSLFGSGHDSNRSIDSNLYFPPFTGLASGMDAAPPTMGTMATSAAAPNRNSNNNCNNNSPPSLESFALNTSTSLAFFEPTPLAESIANRASFDALAALHSNTATGLPATAPIMTNQQQAEQAVNDPSFSDDALLAINPANLDATSRSVILKQEEQSQDENFFREEDPSESEGSDPQDGCKFRAYQAENWTERFEELMEYNQTHGDCLVPNNYPTNPALAQWVKRQRYQYKLKLEGKRSTMSEERAAALERVNFVWDSHSAAWEQRFNELCEYRLTNGNCNVPSRYQANRKLAIWVKRQRRQYKFYCENLQSSMTPERVQILEDVGFEWDVKKSQKQR